MHGMRVGKAWITTVATALLLLLPAPAEGEQWEAVALGTPGLTLGALTAIYTTDGAAEALPGTVALVEHGSGVYSVTGLPDVAAGAGTVHSLTLIYAGASHVYTWPLSTRTPTQVSEPLFYQLPSGTVELAVGATGPDPSLTVRRLAADPTGATVSFNLYSRSGQSRTLAGTATLDSVEAASDGTWTAGLLYSWAAADTATACAGCYGRFTLTLPAGEVLILPPAPQSLRVTIYE
jgi:hypothetical protein